MSSRYKIVTARSEAALIYLIQKLSKSLRIWEQEWNCGMPTLGQFIASFIAEKGFNNITAKIISVDAFWESYSSTIEGFTAESDFEFSKNSNSIPYVDLLVKDVILQVNCFDNEWSEHNSLIETKDQCVLYHWASAA